MGQGPCAAGKDDASVDAAAAVDRALGACASVMTPAVSDMRASSVEVPGDLWQKGSEWLSQGYLGSGTFKARRDSGVGVGAHFWHTERGLDAQEQVRSRL